ncbi:MAG: hypothetical protein HY722_16970 [Planctomycetes bacterium]|nr:hypothetical protein [Planctomycetota bacterium]
MPKGFQLSRLTLNHIEFVHGLLQSRAINEEQAVGLVADGLRGMPENVRRVLFPINKKVYRIITDHLSQGYRKISIWSDGKGKRYVAADVHF